MVKFLCICLKMVVILSIFSKFQFIFSKSPWKTIMAKYCRISFDILYGRRKDARNMPYYHRLYIVYFYFLWIYILRHWSHKIISRCIYIEFYINCKIKIKEFFFSLLSLVKHLQEGGMFGKVSLYTFFINS